MTAGDRGDPRAEVTLRSVAVARSTAIFTASSKPVVERAEISVTRATSLMAVLLVGMEGALASSRPAQPTRASLPRARPAKLVPVRFHAEHHFAAPAVEVVALLLDPGFHRGLELPDLALLAADEGEDEGGRSVLRLRYDFVGNLDRLAQRLLGGRRLTWFQELRLDRSTGTGRLTFAAESAPDKLRGAAELRVRPDGGGTVRRIDGELVVSVPLVGRTAERRIVPGLQRRLDIEARALDERLGS